MAMPGSGSESKGVEEKVVIFITSVLSGIVAPQLLHNAVSGAMREVGWTHIPLPAVAQTQPPPDKSGKADGASAPAKGEKKRKATAASLSDGEPAKKEKAPRAINTFQCWVTLMLDRVSKDPEHPSYKIAPIMDANNQPQQPRGGKLSLVSSFWAHLPDEPKAIFNRAYKPLCDLVNEEVTRSGLKMKNLLQRIQEYHQSLTPDVRARLEGVFKEAETLGKVKGTPAQNTPPAKKAAAAAPAVPAESDSDEEDEDDEEEEEEKETDSKAKQGKGASNGKEDDDEEMESADSEEEEDSDDEDDDEESDGITPPPVPTAKTPPATKVAQPSSKAPTPSTSKKTATAKGAASEVLKDSGVKEGTKKQSKKEVKKDK